MGRGRDETDGVVIVMNVFFFPMKTTVADLGQRRKLMEVRCQHLRSFDEVGPESVKTMRLQCSKETFRVITMPTITKIPFGATECATRIDTEIQ